MRRILLAAVMLVPFAAHAHSSPPSPYSRLTSTPYSCGSGDNSATINGLLSAGGEVDLAAGICTISHPLVMTVPGTILNGAGDTASGTIIKATTALAFDVLTIGNANTTWHGAGFVVENLELNGIVTTNPGSASKTGRCLVVEGGTYADTSYTFGAQITSVQAYNCLDGISIAGSDVSGSSLNIHDNWHSGWYVSGNGNLSSPHNIANNDSVVSSKFDDNELENSSSQTWDTIDFDTLSGNGTVGGLPAGTYGNSVTSGDILMSCNPTNSKCSTSISGFTVQGNTVTNPDNLTWHSGIRAYGAVDSVLVDTNTLTSTQGTGVHFTGPVTNAIASNNTISSYPAYGVNVDTISGYPAGDTIKVKNNSVTMGNVNKPAVSVTDDTNVTATGNSAAGQTCSNAYSWSAGSGFSESGNTASGTTCP